MRIALKIKRLLLITCSLVLMGTAAISQNRRKPATPAPATTAVPAVQPPPPGPSRPGPKPYKDVITAKAKSSTGLFTHP